MSRSCGLHIQIPGWKGIAAALASAMLLLTFAHHVDRAHAESRAFTNDSGEPASYFVFIAASSYVPMTVLSQPAGCGTPQEIHGFEYGELIWPTACIGPGQSITLDTLGPSYPTYGSGFGPRPPTMTAINSQGVLADELTVSSTSKAFAGAVVIENPPGCGKPSVTLFPTSVRIMWPSVCVHPGEQVVIHVAGSNAGGYDLLFFKGAQPYRFSGVIVDGGVAEYPNVSSGSSARLLASLLLGALAVLLASGAFAWRRKLSRDFSRREG